MLRSIRDQAQEIRQRASSLKCVNRATTTKNQTIMHRTRVISSETGTKNLRRDVGAEEKRSRRCGWKSKLDVYVASNFTRTKCTVERRSSQCISIIDWKEWRILTSRKWEIKTWKRTQWHKRSKIPIITDRKQQERRVSCVNEKRERTE